MITLKKEFQLSAEDVKFLEALPDNAPDTKLTSKQREQIDGLYRKFITPMDRYYGELLHLEMAEKWPSGPRMKKEQAQRILLGFLQFENNRAPMSDKRAAFHFFASLGNREASIKVVSKVWTIKPVYK